jgi:hypothetical protein
MENVWKMRSADISTGNSERRALFVTLKRRRENNIKMMLIKQYVILIGSGYDPMAAF